MRTYCIYYMCIWEKSHHKTQGGHGSVPWSWGFLRFPWQDFKLSLVVLSLKIDNSHTYYLIFAQDFQTYMNCQHQSSRRLDEKQTRVQSCILIPTGSDAMSLGVREGLSSGTVQQSGQAPRFGCTPQAKWAIPEKATAYCCGNFQALIHLPSSIFSFFL